MKMSANAINYKEVVVIGCGISGLALSRWLKEYQFDFVAFERTDDIGGLWRYREDDYGVMKFTHINVSKYNYCFSDHSFPNDSADFPHHTEMYNYIKTYANKHELFDQIVFNSLIKSIEEVKELDSLDEKPTFKKITLYEKLWKVIVKDLKTEEEKYYVTPFVCVATGHHQTPKHVEFPGQSSFKGTIFHSVKYKSSTFNDLNGKRVLVVGIGNSAVDIAVNLIDEGRCPKVCISTRSGSWIIPNYISGYPIDLYACRFSLNLPWKILSYTLESNIKLIYGKPELYNLNPKMKASQTQPTLNPTLIHHIQRKNISIKQNIKFIEGNNVIFENNEQSEFDAIILCTGYHIDLKFLHEDIRKKIFFDEEETKLNLFKHVFNPDIGPSLSFIGYVQPTSGGILGMSEIQSRFVIQTILKQSNLPEKFEMKQQIINDQEKMTKRFYNSGSTSRLTIQQDPIIYNDELASMFGAKPNYFENLHLFWKLLFSSCGPAQWRLSGPDKIKESTDIVNKVPVTPMMNFVGITLLIIIVLLLLILYKNPLLLIGIFSLIFFYWKKLHKIFFD